MGNGKDLYKAAESRKAAKAAKAAQKSIKEGQVENPNPKTKAVESTPTAGFFKVEGGHGPKGTAMSNMWGGESVEMGKQMGANRDFLKGPGSKHRDSESTFNAEHSGIVKQGMDPGLYKVTSGMHKGDPGMYKEGGEGGAPFHVIEARNTAVETLQNSRDKENELRDEGFEAAGEAVEGIAESTGLKEEDEDESPGGDTEIYSGEDLEGKDYSNFGQDTVDEAMDVDTDLVSMGKKKKKSIDFNSFFE